MAGDAKPYRDAVVFGFDITGSSKMSPPETFVARKIVFPAFMFALQSTGVGRSGYEFHEVGDSGVAAITHPLEVSTIFTTTIPAMHEHMRRNPAYDAPAHVRYGVHRGRIGGDPDGWCVGAYSELNDLLHRTSGMAGTVVLSQAVYTELFASDNGLTAAQKEAVMDWQLVQPLPEKPTTMAGVISAGPFLAAGELPDDADLPPEAAGSSLSRPLKVSGRAPVTPRMIDVPPNEYL